MKKYTLLVLTLFTSAISFGQSIRLDPTSNKYQSTGIIYVDSIKKDDLFLRAKHWAVLNYRSANDVIQLADKESSKIILKGNYATTMFMKGCWLEHTLILDFKDGKIRYTYNDFGYSDSNSRSLPFEGDGLMFKKKIIKRTEDHMIASVENLKNYLLNNSKNSDSDNNW
ncbi:MAG: DUF4468 domain-containing protein [Sphingobacteriaceae bacterium]